MLPGNFPYNKINQGDLSQAKDGNKTPGTAMQSGGGSVVPEGQNAMKQGDGCYSTRKQLTGGTTKEYGW
jgi:hypothetical protein